MLNFFPFCSIVLLLCIVDSHSVEIQKWDFKVDFGDLEKILFIKFANDENDEIDERSFFVVVLQKNKRKGMSSKLTKLYVFSRSTQWYVSCW